MTKRLPDLFEDMRQALLGNKPDHNWGESTGDIAKAAAGSVKDFGGETLTKTAERFNEAMPYIERAGYSVTEIEVGLGLSPKVTAHLNMEHSITAEQKAELLEETTGRKLVQTILTTLFKASDARQKLKFKKFHFVCLELELSILPSVILKFLPGEETENANTDITTNVIVTTPEEELGENSN